MKRFVSLLLALVMVLALTACGSASTTTAAPAAAESEGPGYKIGIITGTVSQGDEEIGAAMKMKEMYPDIVVTATYPDNFSTETEQTIATVTNMAADPEVKAIVFVQAVPGATAAINKVRETRDDILFVCGVAAEDPAVIAAAADVVMLVDEISMGTSVIDQAAAQGAKTFIHVSFERHLGYATIAARQQLFKERCAELGIEYVEQTAPDPTGDAGVPGAQAWITENIAPIVDKYGKDTAFFSTNCSLQVPLIQQVAQLGAIYPVQCCPSPYHAYPSAFNIDTAGHEGDIAYLNEQIKAKVAEYGNTGRMSTWPISVNMTMIEAGFNYANKWINGEITERCDADALLAEIQAVGGEGMEISNYSDDNGTLDNFFMINSTTYNNY